MMQRRINDHKASGAWKVLVRAIATRRVHDSDFRNAIASYNQAKRDAENADEELDNVSKLALSKGTWLMAMAIGEGNKLDTLKCDIFGYSKHPSADVDFRNTILVKVRSYTEKLIDESVHAEPVESITQHTLPKIVFRDTTEVFTMKATLLVPHIRNEVCKPFKDGAGKLSGRTNTNFILVEAKFAYTAYALRHFSVSNCVNRYSGFIDGAEPEKSYVYKSMKKLAKKNGYAYPKLLRYTYSGVIQLAEEIDNSGTLPYKVVDVVSFVNVVLNNVVVDLLMGKVYTPPKSIFYNDDFFDVVDPPTTCEDVVMEEEELIAYLSAWMEKLDEDREKERVVIDDYDFALDTYPSPTLAEEYAKVSGYANFREAFEAVGLREAAYYYTSSYVIRAMALHSLGDYSSKKRKGI